MASGSNNIAVPPCSDMEKRKSPQLSFKRRNIVANSDSVFFYNNYNWFWFKINTDNLNIGW